MPHDHHGHAHSHAASAPGSHDRAFALGIGLNSALVLAQLGFGFAAHSMALLADAVHNLGDVLGLGLAWAAAWAGSRGRAPGRTYGWGRSSILAALANAMLLLLTTGAISVEAIRRLLAPTPVHAATIAWVAGIALIVNGATALLFLRGRAGDLNLRGAFQHMAGDAAISGGVLLAALFIAATGIAVIDPLVSLAIALIIAGGTWGLLRESLNLALDAVPEGQSETEIAGFLGALEGVCEVHDLHVWALSTTQTAVTAHLVLAEPSGGEALVGRACAGLSQRFGIAHATIQIETAQDAAACALRPPETV